MTWCFIDFPDFSLTIPFCSVRPSGSESLPGVEDPGVDTFEDVSTCGVTDFPVMDTILEDVVAVGEGSSFCLLRLLLLPSFCF